MTVRYYGQWVDSKGNNHRIDFLYPGTHAETEVRIVSCQGLSPNMKWIDEESVFGRGLDITIISKTKLQFLNELYTANPQGIQIRHIINSTTNFIGWLDSEQYDDSFTDGVNYTINVTANDGMRILERIPISDNSGNKLSGSYRAIDVISFALNKLNLDYDRYRIGLSTTIPGFTLPTSESLLHRVYVKGENYYDEKGDAMNCREVINSILAPFTAKLFSRNNMILITDVNSVTDTFSIRQFNFITLNHIGNTSNITFHDIDKVIGRANTGYANGKHKVTCKFNKYVYGRIDFPIDENTVKDYKYSFTRTDKDGNQFIEGIYAGCEGYSLGEPLSSEFVLVKNPEDNRVIDSFLRVYSQETGQDRDIFFINPFATVASSRKYISVDFGVMIEDIDRYREQRFVGTANQSMRDNEFFMRIKPLITRDGIINTINTAGQWVTGNQASVRLRSRNIMFLNPISGGHAVYYEENSMQQISQVKRWNGKSGSWTIRAEMPCTTEFIHNSQNYFLPGATFPLNSNHANAAATSSHVGGELFIVLQAKDVLASHLTLCFSAVSVSFLEKNQYGYYNPLENNDKEVQGYLNENYSDGFKLETTNGTDEVGMSRGAFLLKVSGNYTDSPAATNERLVDAETFTRQGHTEELELLLLRTYLSNLRVARRTLNCTIDGYYAPQTYFMYSLLQRAGVNVRMMATSMTTDYYNCRTSLELLEVVKDQNI